MRRDPRPGSGGGGRGARPSRPPCACRRGQPGRRRRSLVGRRVPCRAAGRGGASRVACSPEHGESFGWDGAITPFSSAFPRAPRPARDGERGAVGDVSARPSATGGQRPHRPRLTGGSGVTAGAGGPLYAHRCVTPAVAVNHERRAPRLLGECGEGNVPKASLRSSGASPRGDTPDIVDATGDTTSVPSSVACLGGVRQSLPIPVAAERGTAGRWARLRLAVRLPKALSRVGTRHGWPLDARQTCASRAVAAEMGKEDRSFQAERQDRGRGAKATL